jgi:hypothetical protein
MESDYVRGELTEADIHERRKVAVAWLEWACGAPELTEVPEENDRYREVTANLDPGSRGVHPNRFSTCAILAHWMLLQVGVRSAWLDHPAATNGWRADGGVLSRLVVNAWNWMPDMKPQGGDIVVIANRWPSGTDAHVVCVIDVDEDGVWSTAEYGQPGGKLKHARVDSRFQTYLSDGRLSYGREPRCLLSLKEVLQKAFTRGELVEPKTPPQELW